MAFDSKHTTDIQISLEGDNVAYGTAQFGDDYGEVQSARITRDSDLEELKKADGNLSVAIAKNFKFQLSMEINVKATATLPGILERIAFPGANTQGRILNVVEGSTQGGTKTLSITATSWDVFRNREVALVTDGFGAGQYVGPRPQEIDFAGWTFGVVNGAEPGQINGSLIVNAGPELLVTGQALPFSDDGTYVPFLPLVRVSALSDGIVLINADTGTAAVYDIATDQLHFFGTDDPEDIRDTVGTNYVGYMQLTRTLGE